MIDPLMDTAVDTTGAVDLYAAGFQFGLSRGPDMVSCGLGSLAAAEVIAHVGARPAVRRWDLVGGCLG